MNIHHVPICGRLAPGLQGTLSKIETVTTPCDWKGIDAVFVSDEEIEMTKDTTGGHYLIAEGGDFTVRYNDGVKETFDIPPMRPIIIVESGMFKDEYWFTFTLLHELGHHNDPFRPTESTKECEIYANQFALSRMRNADFDKQTEMSPMYYKEALKGL